MFQKTDVDKESVFYVFRESVLEYFGKIGLEKISPDRLSDGTLFVKVRNPNWSSEFLLNREKIMRKINERAGSNLISEIKIK